MCQNFGTVYPFTENRLNFTKFLQPGYRKISQPNGRPLWAQSGKVPGIRKRQLPHQSSRL
jgi:hypothetical protein